MKNLKRLGLVIVLVVTVVVVAGMYKFNYLASLAGYDVDGNKIVKKSEQQKPKLTDNFYKSVNYEWLRDVKIPDYDMGIDAYHSIEINKINNELRTIIENKNPKTDQEIQIRNLYISFTNKEERNKLGASPLKSHLDMLDSANSKNDIALLMGKFNKDGVKFMFSPVVELDFKDSSKYVIQVGQSGLKLSRGQYLSQDKRAVKRRESYSEFLSNLFSYANYDNTKERAKRVLDIETKLAKIQFSPEESRVIEKMYNPHTFKEFSKLLDNYPIDDMFATLNLPKTELIVVNQLPYLKELNKLFLSASIDDWREYLRARLLLKFSNALSDEFSNSILTYKKELGLIKNDAKEWRKTVAFMNKNIPMLLGRVYIDKFFDKKSKKYVKELVDSIKEEFRLAISNSTIFTELTKKKALNKLNKMVYNIGFPEKWRDFSELEIKPNDLMGNLIRINNFNYNFNIAKLGKKVFRKNWTQAPQLVNASYSPLRNKYVLLAGLLNKPLFDINATYAQNYGGVGSVIAHEIGHAFDDQGSMFDATGSLNNWWSDKDKITFDKIKKQLIKEADKYQPYDGIYMSGKLKIGEIIGDINGLKISYKAFSKLIKNDDLRLKANKEFFEQYALVWREKLRREFSLKILKTDPHPPGEFRTNFSLKQLDAFHETYKTKPGDGMYEEPSKRVKLW